MPEVPAARFLRFLSAGAGSFSKPRESVLAGFEEGGGEGPAACGPAPFSARGRAYWPAYSLGGPWGRIPHAARQWRPELLPAGVGGGAPGHSLARPHGGFRGQPEGRPPALLRVGGAAGSDRDPRLQLLEHLLPPRPASGGGGRAAGPGPAHRGGPRALGEAQFRPPALGGLPQEAD